MWRGKNARDRVNEINYKRIGAAFLALAAMLIDEDETISIIFRVAATILIYKWWKIDQWDDEKSDRFPLRALTIEGTTEETCYSDHRFQKAEETCHSKDVSVCSSEIIDDQENLSNSEISM
jgi:hypothetical protein